ncbi:MAG: lamin tail domain-containing protein [Candidatus Jorgensenbacteria bacterium]|nr:lamin tail domain-containing protein [Candidatus Jorgensenbacteria bacterium]
MNCISKGCISFLKDTKISSKLKVVLLVIAAVLVTSGFFITKPVTAATPGDVIINEFVSNPSSGNELVELLNITTSSISLSGWKIQNFTFSGGNVSGVATTTIGAVTIPANSIITVDVTGLNNSGDSITLYDNGATPIVVNHIVYGTVVGFTTTTGLETAPTSGTSGAYISGAWQTNQTPTKGWFNDAGQPSKAPLLSAIDSTLASSGISSNIGELDNPSATPAATSTGLYFEKVGKGKIVFTASLNLSDQATVAVLQDLGQKMQMSDGHVKFDSATAQAMNATGARIYLESLPYTVQPPLIVKNDSGTALDQSGLISDVLYENDPAPACAGDAPACKMMSFSAAHFTQFDIDSNVYVDASNSGAEDGTQAHPYNTIGEGIGAAMANGTIHVAIGTYTEDLTIPAGKTNLDISGAGLASTTIKGVQNVAVASIPLAMPNINVLANGVKIHGFTIEGPNYVSGKYSSGIVIGSSNVDVYSNAFKVTPAANENEISQAIQTWRFSESGTQDISSLNIHNNSFTNLSAGTAGYEGVYINIDEGSGVATIQNNNFSGNVARAITAERSSTTISGNTISTDLAPGSFGVGGWQGINIGGANDVGAVTNVSVSNNTINAITSKGFTYGIKLGFNAINAFSGVSITGNTVHKTGTAGVRVMFAANGIAVNNNDLSDNVLGIKNEDSGNTLNAAKNWWGTVSSTEITALKNGLVSYDPWYLSSTRTILSDAVSGSTVNSTTTDAGLTSATGGQADLPSGATTITLGNSTFLDVSSGKVATSTLVVNGVDQGAAKTIGGQAVTITQSVKLNSGVLGEAISLSNADKAGVSVSIPDESVVYAPTGWNGKIQPPKTGSTDGSAPSGFSVSNSVIEIGSPTEVLIFSKPVTVTLTGVSGNVAYKPSGSTAWTQITDICGGTYESPSSPTFPGECYKSNGTDTKIVTYHFTSFGGLNVFTAVSGGSGTVSIVPDAPVVVAAAGGTPTPIVTIPALSLAAQKIDVNGDNKIDITDFNTLLVNWGNADAGNIADFNSDGKVDIFDFNLLMMYWTL